MGMTREDRQPRDSNTVPKQKYGRPCLRRNLYVCAKPTKIVDQANQENDGCRPQYLQNELRQRKFACREILRQPVRQQRHATERHKNRNSAQPRYWTGMNMTVRTWQRNPCASDGKIADQARKCYRT